jgi:hypothetical protein
MLPSIESQRLTAEEIAAILREPNGEFLLMEEVRMDRVDAERAVTAIEHADQGPWLKKFAYAVLSAISSR